MARISSHSHVACMMLMVLPSGVMAPSKRNRLSASPNKLCQSTVVRSLELKHDNTTMSKFLSRSWSAFCFRDKWAPSRTHKPCFCVIFVTGLSGNKNS